MDENAFYEDIFFIHYYMMNKDFFRLWRQVNVAKYPL